MYMFITRGLLQTCDKISSTDTYANNYKELWLHCHQKENKHTNKENLKKVIHSGRW